MQHLKRDVSVVIPVKNGEATLKRCLDGILSQTVEVKEIVIVDSGSEDGTLALLGEYPEVKLVEIPPADFNHGDTRNLGVSHATGEYIVLTVQDAWPVDRFWLENLMKGFVNESVVAVCGQQVVPHEKDKNPAEWFRPYSAPAITTLTFTPGQFEALSPSELKQACSWDNVTAIYRRDALQAIPFSSTIFAEDAIWASDTLRAGYTITYNYAARVFHYHHYDTDFAFKRIFAEIYSTYKIFNLPPSAPRRSFRAYLRLAKLIWIAEGMTIKEKLYWWGYNIMLRRSYRRAVAAFYNTAQSGEVALERFYFELCNKISSADTTQNKISSNT